MFVPHKPKGTIWIVSGPDLNNLTKVEYTGVRTYYGVQEAILKAAKKGENFAYAQYESPTDRLQSQTPLDLLRMGVLAHKRTEGTTVDSGYKNDAAKYKRFSS